MPKWPHKEEGSGSEMKRAADKKKLRVDSHAASTGVSPAGTS
jgi:hypothetical protein